MFTQGGRGGGGGKLENRLETPDLFLPLTLAQNRIWGKNVGEPDLPKIVKSIFGTISDALRCFCWTQPLVPKSRRRGSLRKQLPRTRLPRVAMERMLRTQRDRQYKPEIPGSRHIPLFLCSWLSKLEGLPPLP